MTTIPWYKMPMRLRSLPLDEREAALTAYEAHFGEYDWKSEICLDAYADEVIADEASIEVADAYKNNTV